MPLREDILNPVFESNPGGDNLRYHPVYDKIKEARRQDDDAAQGDWQVERKTADYPLVIKLASEAIATRSKDLQLAAWLTEALLRQNGFAGLAEGLSLIRSLVEQFWDTLWPEIDDGDVEMRAAPIDWVGQYLDLPVKRVPLVRGGHDYLKYLEAKAVGKEPGWEDSDAKREAYAEAIADGRMPLDEFESAVAGTSRESLESMLGSIDACLQLIEDSQPLFEEKFGEYAPSYSRLRTSLEEVRRAVASFVKSKGEPEAATQDEAVEETEPAADEAGDDSWQQQPAEEERVPVVQRKPARRVSGLMPADLDEAAARVAAVAAFWRAQDSYNPAPYLMLRGMRWGEVRAAGSLDANLFEPPSTEVRTALRRLMSESNYSEAIEMAENAMAEPCGRAWLDLQRYVVTACEGLGYSAIADAIRSELRTYLRDFPDLLNSTLLDDTPTANAETVRWCNEIVGATTQESPTAMWPEPPPVIEEERLAHAAGDGEPATPDSFELASAAARAGRIEEAVEILSDEISHQSSGRGRFQRKLQLAQLCLGAGQNAIAHALLEELAAEVDRHQLESWEAADFVAHVLSLLYSCGGEMDPQTRSALYARICRLSPAYAMRHGTHAFAHGR